MSAQLTNFDLAATAVQPVLHHTAAGFADTLGWSMPDAHAMHTLYQRINLSCCCCGASACVSWLIIMMQHIRILCQRYKSWPLTLHSNA
jgi:hypothetical protein